MKRNFAYLIFLAELILILLVYQRSFGNSEELSVDATARGASQFPESCAICHSIQRGEAKVEPALYGVLRKGSGGIGAISAASNRGWQRHYASIQAEAEPDR